MALIKCPECGKKVSEYSDKCPQCGCPMEKIKKNMDKDIPASISTHSSSLKTSSQKKVIIGLGISVVVLLIVVATWIGIKTNNSPKIADITIDRVTPELAAAIKQYDELNNFSEGLAIVKKKGKYGYIDKLGHEIIPCKYDDADDFENGIAVISINEKEGAIDNRGQVIIPIEYDWIAFSKDSIAVAQKEGRYGMIDITGKIIIPFEFDHCNDFSEGLAAVVNGGKLGFANKKGEIVIPCEYEYDENDIHCRNCKFSQGLAAVRRSGKYGYINILGELIIPFQAGLIGTPFYRGGSSIIEYAKQNEIQEVGKDFKWEWKPLTKLPNHKFAFIDCVGNIISQWYEVGFFEDMYWYDGYVKYNSAGNHGNYGKGLLGCDGNVWLETDMYDLIDYRGDGIVAVGKYSTSGLKWGIYDLLLQQLSVPIIYDNIGYISDGIVSAKKDSKEGFINLQNEPVIPFCYDRAGSFSEGFAVVQKFGKYGYVDRYGMDTFSNL